VNASGECFLTHTSVRGRYTLRFAVGSPYTRIEHVERAWRRLADAATDVRAGAAA
jgi:aromatic-L-amino-acid decarboxylase